jgi:hypothetical protein
MNGVTIRQPSKLGWSDSCPFGIGGFLLSGRAWRVKIPQSSPIYGADIANNVLEFLGMAVTIWLAITEPLLNAPTLEKIRPAYSPSATTRQLLAGSTNPASCRPTRYYRPVQMIARKLARLIMNSTHCLASQHIQGDHNTVSDLLSFASDDRGYPHPLAPDSPPDDILTQRFHSHIPQSIPEGFKISPLPNEISSFLIQALQTIDSSLIRSKRKPTRKRIVSSDDGPTSVPPQDSTITHSSLSYEATNASSSFGPFSPSTEWLTGAKMEPFLASVRAPWFRRLCAMPQAIWLRRSGVASNKVPFTSKGAPSYSPPSAPS